MANVKVLHEVKLGNEGEYRLCFHWAEYNYDDGSSEKGYRFMWEDSEGRKKPHLGQARIPSANDMFALIGKAAEAGWLGEHDHESH